MNTANEGTVYARTAPIFSMNGAPASPVDAAERQTTRRAERQSARGAGLARAGQRAWSAVALFAAALLLTGAGVLTPGAAWAQTLTILSNTGQSLASVRQDGAVAQAFSTGSNSAGYTLFGVDVRLGEIGAGSWTVTVRDSDANGFPTSTVRHTLTAFDSLVANSVNTFGAPENATLAANGTYHIVVEPPGAGTQPGTPGVGMVLISAGADTIERDDNADSGWAFVGGVRGNSGGTWQTIADTTNRMMVAISGSVTGQEDAAFESLLPEITVAAMEDTVVGNGINEVVFVLTWSGTIGDDGTIEFSLPTSAGVNSNLEGSVNEFISVADAASGRHEFRLRTESIAEGGSSATVTLTVHPAEFYYRVAAPGSATVTVTALPAAEAPDNTEGQVTISHGLGSSFDLAAALANGASLTAVTTAITDDDGLGPFSYQWRRANNASGDSEADIPNANSYIYTPTSDDVSRHLQVVVSFTDGGGTAEMRASAWTATAVAAVSPANDPATGDLTVAGEFENGKTLTAVTTDISDPDGPDMLSFTYRWQRADDGSGTAAADIADATASTYVPTLDDVRRYLQVVARFTDTEGHIEEKESGWRVVALVSDAPATGEPAIHGLVEVGETLAASPGTVDDVNGLPTGAGGYRYQWRRADDAAGTNDGDISGETSSLYRVAVDDRGRHLQVVVSFTDGNGYPQARSSAWTAAVTQGTGNSSPTGALTITGSPTTAAIVKAGETLTAAVTTTITDADGPATLTFTYQWRRADDAAGTNAEDIAGANSLVYPVTAADLGKFLQASALYTDGLGNREAVRSDWVAPELAATGAPTVDGVLQVMRTLTALTGEISDVNGLGTFSYQWRRADDAAGAAPADIGTGMSTYTLVDADNGKFIQVEVSFTDGSGATETVTSEEWAGPVTAFVNNSPTGALVITGIAEVGRTLTVVTAGVTDADGPATPIPEDRFTYQWSRADNAAGLAEAEIDMATEATYELTTLDMGKRLRVVVMFTDDLNTMETLTSRWTRVGVSARTNKEPVGRPTITGIAEVGRTLTAVTTGISDADGPDMPDFTYQWRWADDTSSTPVFANIGTGATQETHTLTNAAEGRIISVVVSYTDGGGTMENVESLATNVVEGFANNAPTGDLTISGVAEVGRTLTAVTTGISDADGPDMPAFSYQWWRADDAAGTNAVEIATATMSTYTPTEADDLNKHLQVVVSYTDSFSTPETVSSDWTLAVARPLNTEPTGKPTFTGNFGDGETLTVDTTAGVPDGIMDDDALPTTAAEFTYQWRRADDVAGMGDAPITGETGATYTQDATDVGKFFQVVVSYTDGRSFRERVSSDWRGANVAATGMPRVSGTARVGQTLTAMAPGDITDANGLPESASGYSYQWRRADEADGTGEADIATAATGTTYNLVAADNGKFIQVVVSFVDGNNYNESRSSDWMAVNNDATAPTISGALVLGQTLMAVTAGMDLDGVTMAQAGDAGYAFTYQWRRADDASGMGEADIATNGNAATYTPVDADVGKHLQVVVSFRDDADFNENIASAWTTGPVSVPDPTSLSISGEGSIGTMLTLSGVDMRWHNVPSPISASHPGANLLSWLRCEQSDCSDVTLVNAVARSISAATGRLTYEIAAPVVAGNYIQVTAADLPAGFTSVVTGTSVPLATVIYGPICAVGTGSSCTASENTPATGAVTIDGGDAPQVEVELTANTSTIMDADGPASITAANFTYQWRSAEDASGTNPADITTGGTDATYTPVEGDVGSHLQVVVTFTDDADHEQTFSSAWTAAAVIAAGAPDPTDIAISGDGRLGNTLMVMGVDPTWDTASIDLTNAPPGSNLLAWTICKQDDCLDLVGLNAGQLLGRSLTSASGMLSYTIAAPVVEGDFIQVAALDLPNGFGDLLGGTSVPLASAIFGPICAAGAATCDARQVNNPATGTVTISGTPQADEELTAMGVDSIMDDDGLTMARAGDAGYAFTYQWRSADDANGMGEADIAGATSDAYTPVDADVDKHLQVVVSFMDDDDNQESIASDWTAAAVLESGLPVITVSLPTDGERIISGNDVVFVLSRTGDPAAELPVTVSYTGEAALTNANPSTTVTFGATNADERVELASNTIAAGQPEQTVTLTVAPGTGYRVSTTSASGSVVVRPVNAAATGTPSISGDAEVGRTLTAARGTIADTNGVPATLSYQWWREETDGTGRVMIGGATSATYELMDAEEGKKILVSVTFTDDDGYDEGPLVSAVYPATGAVIPRTNIDAEGMPTISGVFAVGRWLTAVTSGITDEDGPEGVIPAERFSYQWWSENEDGTGRVMIAGETGATYQINDEELEGKKILVSVTFTDDGDTEETLVSIAYPEEGTVAAGATAQQQTMDQQSSEALLNRFGALAAVQVLDFVKQRFDAPRAPGVRGTLAGYNFGGGGGYGGAPLGGGSGGYGGAPLGGGSGYGGFAGGFGNGATGGLAGIAAPGGFGNGGSGDFAGAGLGTTGGFGGSGGFDADASVSGGNAPAFSDASGQSSSLRGPGSGNAAGARELPSGRNLLNTTSFSLTQGMEGGGVASVWGRAAFTAFETRQNEVHLDGDMSTAQLGLDWSSGSWLVGISAALSDGESEYRQEHQGVSQEGDIEASLTGVYPYIGYRFSESLSAWTTLGYGTGDLKVNPDNRGGVETDMDLLMGALGVRDQVLRPAAAGGVAFAMRADLVFARTSSDAVAGRLEKTETDTHRMRFGLEASREVVLSGGVFSPTLEVGVLIDGGDLEHGAGVDVGAGVAYSGTTGLSLHVRGRTLLAHGVSDTEEWGVSGELRYDPASVGGRGPSLSLSSGYGARAAGGVDDMFSLDMSDSLDQLGGGGAPSDLRMEAELGYGLSHLGGRYTGTPWARIGLTPGSPEWRLGWRFTPFGAWAPELSTGVEYGSQGESHGIRFRLDTRF